MTKKYRSHNLFHHFRPSGRFPITPPFSQNTCYTVTPCSTEPETMATATNLLNGFQMNRIRLTCAVCVELQSCKSVKLWWRSPAVTLPRRQTGTDWGSLGGRGGIPHAVEKGNQSQAGFQKTPILRANKKAAFVMRPLDGPIAAPPSQFGLFWRVSLQL